METLIKRGRPKGIKREQVKLHTSLRYLGSDIPNHPDMGCEEATAYLGYQSHCLQCPFVVCVFDLPDKRKRKIRKPDEQREKRNEEIKRLLAEGKKPEELSEIFGISRKLISKIKNS